MNATKEPLALGIDIGGTKILAGLVSNCKLLGEPLRVPTPKGPDKIIETFLDIIKSFQQKHLLCGVGISTAGIVDPISGQVLGAAGNMPGWEGTAVKQIIQNKTGLKIHVENDGNAAAYGECHAAGFGHKTCVVMVTLGTGIGGGIVMDGKLYHSAHFVGGHIGHIKISVENRRRCTCELWDCWEAYGSGRGLVLTGHEYLAAISDEKQSLLVSKRNSLTTEDILEAAQNGDLIAKQILQHYHEHVSIGFAGLCNILDPDCFVVSGGMSKFMDLSLLKNLVSERALPRIRDSLEIYPSILGEPSGLIGAGQLIIDAISEGSTKKNKAEGKRGFCEVQ